MSVLDRAFAAVYDPMMARVERAGLAELRREQLAAASGRVLEIGAGTGANLAAYPPDLDRAVLLEPVAPMAERLRRHVAEHPPAYPVEILEAPAEALPARDATFDTVVSTLVLCSVDDPQRALAEIRRVLRPGGRLLLIEHVAGDPAWLQKGLDPAWATIARGCHLRRDTRAELRRAGFDVSDLEDVSLPMPPPVRPGLVGAARA
jgi:ubiquinone/menaquinone biosynthesis C-methylase UbiE